MSERTFVDTNVWVYAIDASDPGKRERAREVLSPGADQNLIVSSQVLSEFYVTITRKLAAPVSPVDALAMVEQMARLPVVAVDASLVTSAISGSQEWQVSYWDALIVRAAEVAGCDRLLSEDLADGQEYGSVRVENPFAASGRQR